MRTIVSPKTNKAHILIALIFFIGMFLLLSLVSCNAFKKVSKTETTTESKTNTVTNQSTITTETEITAADTNVHIAGSTIRGEKPIDNIVKGDSLKTSNNDVVSVVTYDEASKSIIIKTSTLPRVIPIKIKEEKTKTTVSNSSASTGQDTKAVAKTMNKKVFNLPWWVWLLPVVVLGWVFRKKIPGLKKITTPAPPKTGGE